MMFPFFQSLGLHLLGQLLKYKGEWLNNYICQLSLDCVMHLIRSTSPEGV